MDWRNSQNEDTDDYANEVENYLWDERNTLVKSRSDINIGLNYNSCSQELQTAEDVDDLRYRNLSSVFERIELAPELDTYTELLSSRTKDSQVCTCANCMKQKQVIGFQTREKPSQRLVVQGPEILNYQGTRQRPSDIAPYWKKDSRMWLWKSVRKARKRQLESGVQDDD